MIGGKKIVGENEYIVYGEIGDIKLMQYKDHVMVGLDAAKEIVLYASHFSKACIPTYYISIKSLV